MRNHNGMRPQDVVVMLKIISINEQSVGNSGVTNKFLAESLKLSQAEITHSIKRSAFAGLLEPEQKRVNKRALLDFLKYGIRYVFPDQPGKIVRGVPTAHSARPLSDVIVSSDNYVWASIKGSMKGQELNPLYDKIPEVVKEDDFLYRSLALIDAIRVGKNREYVLANKELEKMIMKNE